MLVRIMPSAEPARILFDSINRAKIYQFKKEQKSEDVHLDFKDPEKMKRSDIQRTLSKCVSGLANADGGVVVWGVVAEKTDTPEGMVDAVTEIKPIPGVRAFCSRLRELTVDATNPIVDGVEHEIIFDDKSKKTGFVKTLVPVSDRTPHMAMYGEYRYFKRNGDTTRKMEHFDVEDMFGRRRRPVLEFETELVAGSTSGDQRQYVNLVIGIRNTGRALARFPSLEVRVFRGKGVKVQFNMTGLGTNKTGLPKLDQRALRKNRRHYVGGIDDVIHVGQYLQVDSINFVLTKESKPQDFRFAYRISADGIMARSGRKTLSGDIVKRFGLRRLK